MTPDIEDAISRHAYSMGIDVALLRAICIVETGCDPWKVRFEPNWKYAGNTAKYAALLGISEETEKSLQSHSWGIMQIMGTVARELGYCGPLQKLSQIDLGLFYGCYKLQKLMARYSDLSDVIASYNAGSPIKNADGNYINQNYVAKVLTLMK